VEGLLDFDGTLDSDGIDEGKLDGSLDSDGTANGTYNGSFDMVQQMTTSWGLV
jgi:hypothetical protein